MFFSSDPCTKAICRAEVLSELHKKMHRTIQASVEKTSTGSKSKNKAVAVAVDTKSPPSFTVFLLSNVVVLKLLR